MSLFSLLPNLQFLNSPLNFTSSWIKEIKFFFCVYAADNDENDGGENKIAEREEGGGCEVNEEIHWNGKFGLSCLVVYGSFNLIDRILLCFKIIACNCSLSQQGCLPRRC
ncbi:hypothetical protein H5410_012274 [Solanum commersonii]|uniref:Uncharacterized protein n=1 Tax=Solanum commersonii TaxID=4109 RepID=A0A9J6AQZ2_SOLCO|nr:hypothetical protein H5410_012274 [Solanum commersonii]